MTPPARPLRPCPHPGCSEVTANGRCAAHAVQDRRVSPRKRGYTARWDRVSLNHRKRHPLCAECQRQGRVTAVLGMHRDGHPNGVTDHIVAWQSGRTEEERERLKFSESNFESLCWSCHGVKTAKEDGSWGNPRMVRYAP